MHGYRHETSQLSPLQPLCLDEVQPSFGIEPSCTISHLTGFRAEGLVARSAIWPPRDDVAQWFDTYGRGVGVVQLNHVYMMSLAKIEIFFCFCTATPSPCVPYISFALS